MSVVIFGLNRFDSLKWFSFFCSSWFILNCCVCCIVEVFRLILLLLKVICRLLVFSWGSSLISVFIYFVGWVVGLIWMLLIILLVLKVVLSVFSSWCFLFVLGSWLDMFILLLVVCRFSCGWVCDGVVVVGVVVVFGVVVGCVCIWLFFVC